MGKIVNIRTIPKAIQLGDWKENFNKKLEPIHRKKEQIEQMKKNIERGK